MMRNPPGKDVLGKQRGQSKRKREKEGDKKIRERP